MGLVYSITWHLGRMVFAIFFRWRVFHPERVPLEGAVILSANHASYMDPPLIGCAIPRAVNYLARDTLFRFPVVGWYLRALNAVPVDRGGGGGAGLKAILDRLLAGGGIVVFPEGTRTSDGRLQTARSGIGLTVIKSTAPVVPVRVFGTFEAWGRQRKIPFPHRIAVKYGHPLDFAALRAEARTCSKARLKEIYQEIADEIMAAIGHLEPCEEKKTFP